MVALLHLTATVSQVHDRICTWVLLCLWPISRCWATEHFLIRSSCIGGVCSVKNFLLLVKSLKENYGKLIFEFKVILLRINYTCLPRGLEKIQEAPQFWQGSLKILIHITLRPSFINNLLVILNGKMMMSSVLY